MQYGPLPGPYQALQGTIGTEQLGKRLFLGLLCLQLVCAGALLHRVGEGTVEIEDCIQWTFEAGDTELSVTQ